MYSPDLITHQIHVRGIVAPGYFTNGVRSGFSVIDVATGTGMELCSDVPVTRIRGNMLDITSGPKDLHSGDALFSSHRDMMSPISS